MNSKFVAHAHPAQFKISTTYIQLTTFSLINNKFQMGKPEPKHTDRMFYALETYCQNLEENIVPHLPLLMDR